MSTGVETRWPYLVGMISIGVAAVMAVVLLWFDVGRVALERETLIRRVIVACEDRKPQTFLMYEACNEAENQAEDAGIELAELPPLYPESIAPGDFVPE